jgi:hypothetical protein
MFQLHRGKRRRKKKSLLASERPPRIAELLMPIQGPASQKLEIFQRAKALGRLDNDDPAEIEEAEAMLKMLADLETSKS